MGYCHCENCRRYSAAPVSAFTLWKKDNVSLTKGAEFLGRFKSSDISDRRYCTKCGSHIAVHPTLGLVDVRIGALRNFPFKPTVHLNYEETVLPMRDGLPKLKDFPRLNRRLWRGIAGIGFGRLKQNSRALASSAVC
jgi:hypothetical protein